jgi:predicted nucleic acid-binding Zn ribbon protein
VPGEDPDSADLTALDLSAPRDAISPREADNPEVGGDIETAARAALSRARAAARAKGLRPGQTGADATKIARRRAKLAGQSRFSASGADARDPQLFGETMERVVGERGWTTEVAVGGVIGRWAEIVGPELAAHVTPDTFEDGILTVRADSTAWATQVRLLGPTLLRRLGEELGEGVVERVVVGGPTGPSWRKGMRRVPGRGPRDTDG